MGMGLQYYLVIVVSMVIISGAMGDKAKDREECRDELVGLAICLPYVGGDAKAPTPDCCNGLKQVLDKNKKCLCVVVRERNDPDLGLNINVTLALGLPSVCHQPANVSQCPALLHMDPNSPEAQVFYQFDHRGISTAPTPTGGGNTMSSNNKGTSSRGKRWLGLEIVFGGAILLLYFII
ncbi:hypothetical protein LWI28_011086 [Acer negundo]|uniref:Bifunctional inhibitor/plant lipid transfer protein/seed storage helical domain-containing protein n=1 Tax=Acer negundo TaxID=4023 RepID=A0AAD5ILE9_ACENE|nr:hypothetical protein LWI28_011086 [Acer negundo]KAK4842523.1 hypothetical protein QYF36_023168 [Acer negundo]